MKDTMTVIELLNDIVNGKEVPDYIIWNDRIYEKDLETDYVCHTYEGEPKYFLNEVLISELNDEVKIPNIKLKKTEEITKESINDSLKGLKDLDEVGMLQIDFLQVLGTGSEYIQIDHDLRTLKYSLNDCIRRVNLLTKEIRGDEHGK